jgi:hypothetical protein
VKSKIIFPKRLFINGKSLIFVMVKKVVLMGTHGKRRLRITTLKEESQVSVVPSWYVDDKYMVSHRTWQSQRPPQKLFTAIDGWFGHRTGVFLPIMLMTVGLVKNPFYWSFLKVFIGHVSLS